MRACTPDCCPDACCAVLVTSPTNAPATPPVRFWDGLQFGKTAKGCFYHFIAFFGYLALD
jgi:hypothetical protein